MRKEESGVGSARALAGVSDAGKVLVVAVDALDPKMTGRFLDDMPTLRRIKAEGYSGPILPYASTWGNMNFMSMVTGAPPGTHKRVAYPDGSEPVAPSCTAEPIWQTLGDAGRRSLLISFPQGGPTGSPHAAAVSCGGRYHQFLFPGATLLFPGVVHQTRNMPDGVVDRSGHETSGWPPGGGPRVGRLHRYVEEPRPAPSGQNRIGSKKAAFKATIHPSGQPDDRWRVVGCAPDGAGNASLLIIPDPEGPPAAELRSGQWSEWIRSNFELPGGGREGYVRFRLLALDTENKGFQLLQSAGCPTEGFAEPESLGEEMIRRLGPYSAISGIGMYPHDPFWPDGVAESQEREMWIADAAEAGIEAWGWDFFLTKSSLVDSGKHHCAMPVDPDYHRYDPEEAKKHESVLRAAHAANDAVFVRYLEICEKTNATLIIAGDHGMGLNNVMRCRLIPITTATIRKKRKSTNPSCGRRTPPTMRYSPVTWRSARKPTPP